MYYENMKRAVKVLEKLEELECVEYSTDNDKFTVNGTEIMVHLRNLDETPNELEGPNTPDIRIETLNFELTIELNSTNEDLEMLTEGLVCIIKGIYGKDKA